MVPSSVAKRKTAAAEIGVFALVTPEILKACWPAAMLKTAPVGVPVDPKGSAGEGMVTTKVWGVPAELYSVDTPEPLSEIQNGDAAEVAMPHGFTSLGSKNRATCATPFPSVSVGT